MDFEDIDKHMQGMKISETFSVVENRVKSPIEGSQQLIFQSLWIDANDCEDVKGTSCDICLGNDDNEGDEIVMCDGCNVAVHQSCYGREINKILPDENK